MVKLSDNEITCHESEGKIQRLNGGREDSEDEAETRHDASGHGARPTTEPIGDDGGDGAGSQRQTHQNRRDPRRFAMS